MSRHNVLFVVLALFAAAPSRAQDSSAIRRVELALDVSYQANRSNDVTRGWNAPVGFRLGAVNSTYRFTLDERITIGDQRLKNGDFPVKLDVDFGWRLGSAEHVHHSILGPYAFAGFNLTGPQPYYDDEATYRAGWGFSGGVGVRLALFQLILRPELVVGHDLGSGSPQDDHWVPARTRIAFRLGYGIPIGGSGN